MSILVAGVRLIPYLIGPLYPAPDARSPHRIRQSSRMVGPIIVFSMLLVTGADAGRRAETLFWPSLLARSKSGQRLVQNYIPRYDRRPFLHFRKACVAKPSTDIALCSPSAGCRVVKVSLRCSRRGTLLKLSRALAFMSVEGGDVTKLVS